MATTAADVLRIIERGFEERLANKNADREYSLRKMEYEGQQEQFRSNMLMAAQQFKYSKSMAEKQQSLEIFKINIDKLEGENVRISNEAIDAYIADLGRVPGYTLSLENISALTDEGQIKTELKNYNKSLVENLMKSGASEADATVEADRIYAILSRSIDAKTLPQARQLAAQHAKFTLEEYKKAEQGNIEANKMWWTGDVPQGKNRGFKDYAEKKGLYANRVGRKFEEGIHYSIDPNFGYPIFFDDKITDTPITTKEATEIYTARGKFLTEDAPVGQYASIHYDMYQAAGAFGASKDSPFSKIALNNMEIIKVAGINRLKLISERLELQEYDFKISKLKEYPEFDLETIGLDFGKQPDPLKGFGLDPDPDSTEKMVSLKQFDDAIMDIEEDIISLNEDIKSFKHKAHYTAGAAAALERMIQERKDLRESKLDVFRERESVRKMLRFKKIAETLHLDTGEPVDDILEELLDRAGMEVKDGILKHREIIPRFRFLKD